MKTFFYKIIIFFFKNFSVWIMSFFVYIITSFYYFFIPSRTALCSRFYRSIFPEIGKFKSYCYTWKQYHNFSKLYLDRLFVLYQGDISFVSEGWNHIENLKSKGKGGILLMSHVGNWEIAAHLLKSNKMDLLLYMGVKNKEQIEKIQKSQLKESGIKIIAVEENNDSPFNVIDGINFLKKGGLVSLAGDLIWGQNKRIIPVNFLGYKVLLPSAPYLFALLSGAPLLVFFAFKTGKKTYQFKIFEPIYVIAKSRKDREQVMQDAAQKYADILGEFVLEHPFEWYHFEPFLIEKIN